MQMKSPDTQAATATRLERQRVLHEGARRFVFLLAEQVLYSQVPSASAMVEQLDRIADAVELSRVSLGIIPATNGMGAHTQAPFWIFDDKLVGGDADSRSGYHAARRNRAVRHGL
jgi:hypothetical protein